MTQSVELPLWLFVLILLFAAVTFASHFLFPSVRWFLRRRMERVVARLNERLERPIEPFKLARRTDMIQRLIYDPQVAEAIREHAQTTGDREDVAFEAARRYAREIVPSFSATAYFGFATRAAKWLSTKLFRVRLGYYQETDYAELDTDATLVFVMNHRSNMDYVLVTYLAAERGALSYAVGEWARVWPLRQLIRSMGAYFIRRKSRNALYRRVLSRYVELATAGGVTQAVFPEGGLSLDGRVATAKLGILSYIVAGAEETGRDVIFVPVAINYDRVLEDRILIDAGQRGERRFRGNILSVSAFVARYLWRRITGAAHRFGYAAVSFGEPVHLSAFPSGERRVADLGKALTARIEAVMPVVPVPLVAQILSGVARETTEPALVTEAEALVATLRARGATVHLGRDDIAYSVGHALQHLALRRLIERSGETIRVVEDTRPILQFYAASIGHFLADNAAAQGEAALTAEPVAT